MRVLAISGSLSAGSANTRLLHAAAATAPAGTIQVWQALGQLPFFSPEAEPNAHVRSLRTAVAEAAAVWIATPEYAGGMPGALKNALDWLVGSGELYDKPLVIVSAAPSVERGQHARRWVAEVARMQGAHVRDSFSVAIPPGSSPAHVAAEAARALGRVLAALGGGAGVTPVERVRAALLAQGVAEPLIREFAERTATALEAAAAIGTDVERIVKSLVFMAGERPILVLASGANRVDLGKLAALVGQPIRRASAEQVRQHTGFAIGGVPPLGHSQALATYVDRDLLGYDELWAAAGTPNTVFAIAPHELVRITRGQVEDVAQPA